MVFLCVGGGVCGGVWGCVCVSSVAGLVLDKNTYFK